MRASVITLYTPSGNPENRDLKEAEHYYSVLLQDKLTEFILASQDDETGGFSDRPGDWVSHMTYILHCCTSNSQ